jgi:hypothetical protein
MKCPYLSNCDEVRVFLRPKKQDVLKELMNLPRLSSQATFDKFCSHYLLIGDPPEIKLKTMGNTLDQFATKLRKVLQMLERFKEGIQRLAEQFSSFASMDH